MATDFVLPELGEGLEEGDVVNVLVSPGDAITEGQPLVEVESDKATVEVPSNMSGTVGEVKVQAGDTVSVGQVLLTIEDGASGEPSASGGPKQQDEASNEADGGQASSQQASSKQTSSKSDASEPNQAPQSAKSPAAEPSGGGGPVEVKLPELGEGVEEGEVARVLVSVGDSVEAGQSVVEVESDKATVEVPSDASGKVAEIRVEAGQSITVGQVLVVLEGSQAGAVRSHRSQDQASAPSQPAQKTGGADSGAEGSGPARRDDGPLFAAPSVRMLARRLDVDIRQVPGSGPAGRISKEDVEAFAESPAPAPAESAPKKARAPELQPQTAEGEARREKLSSIRRTIGERMSHSWQTVPHVTLYREVDVRAMEELRQRFKSKAEAQGGKLTITAILVKVCAIALRHHPRANARLDLERQEIVHPDGQHIGVAADTERGLVVPVVRNAGTKSILAIAAELGELASLARDSKLSREQMQGATFSLSNLGGLGIGYFTPIINPPEVAILGVGRSHEDHQGRLMMPLSLSIDHRMLDGADGARLLGFIAEALQDPASLVFEA